VKQSHKTALLWIFLIMVFAVIYNGVSGRQQADPWTYSEFVHQVNDRKVKEITVSGDDIQEIRGVTTEGVNFVTAGRIGEAQQAEFIGTREKPGLIGKVDFLAEEKDAFWFSVLGTWLPMIFLFVIFLFFMRQLQSGGGKAMSFGKSRHKLMNESSKKVTFGDIAGIEEAKEELREIVEFLREPRKFTRLGGRIPKGVLLMGPPGTGKTLLARGVAGEAGTPFFSISGSDFVEMFVGVGASRVRDLFEQGKKNAPCIVFIDEIDAVGRHRGAGLGGGHDEREQTLNQLLVEMDGFDSNEGVILMAATNRPDVLDPALLRPGRFDRRVVVQLPDAKGRHGILKVHTRKVPLSPLLDLETIARGTPGFSGADLENLVNEAALLAARHDKSVVETEDFEAAKDKVLMGAERRSLVLSDDDKRNTAFHEAGHTLVARYLKPADPVHKVTIIPRGQAMGVTQQLPDEDRYSYDYDYVMNRIAILMGGRIAEELVFGHKTTGAGNDIVQATELARKMVCEWGMSNLGTVSYGKGNENPFLGREISKNPDYSEATAERVDLEVERLIKLGYDMARELLETHRDKLDLLALSLLEFETLDCAEIDLSMEGGDIEALRQERSEALRDAELAQKKKAAAEAPDPEETPAASGGPAGNLPDPAEGMAKSPVDPIR
jgi:cell division protease FtsH